MTVSAADDSGYIVANVPYRLSGRKTIDSGGLLTNASIIMDPPMNWKELGIVDNDGNIKPNYALQLDIFVKGNVTALKAGVGQIEFTSGANCDVEEISTNVQQLDWKNEQWTRQVIPLTNFNNSSANPSSIFNPEKVNYFRIYIVYNSSQYVGEVFTLKMVKIRIVDTSKPAPSLEEDPLGDGSFIPAPPKFKLAPVSDDYPTDDVIVMGYNLADYLPPNTDQDATPIVQSLLDGLEAAGGGTVFVPAGEYSFYDSLIIPTGATLCGEWRSPDENPKIQGTIFKIYGGKGNKSGSPFITLTNSSMVRNITFWYPEQTAKDRFEYPPTILGGSYSHVRNVTFVNSYVAYQQGPNMSGCPNVYNAYGTPIYQGMDIDGIADIGRYDNIFFSPDYWINSGLPGAPTSQEDKDALKTWLASDAIAITLRRIDWSYVVFSKIEGYNIGLLMDISYSTEEFENGVRTRYSYPNGHCYGLTFENCETAVFVRGVSSAGEVLSDITINNCDYGIRYIFDENSTGGNLQIADSVINANINAIEQDGSSKMSVISTKINGGLVYADKGALVVSNCEFDTEAPHAVLDFGTTNAIFTGNKVKDGSKFVIDNLGMCPLIVDETAVSVPDIQKVTADQVKTRVTKPPRPVLYLGDNIKNDGSEDVTSAIQALLNQAGNDGGGIVFLPGGRYRLNGSLTVPTNVELRGAVDVGRVPYNIGTVFEVYGGKGQAEGTPTVTLQEKSGIRGIVFDYPEQYPHQSVTEITAYPYAIKGNGKDIYIVNVSCRNGYNGIDLQSARCDNHYVEYFAGICVNNAIRVGAGATGGLINNYQMNYNAMLGGATTGWGVWKNSPSNDQRNAFEGVMKKKTQNDLVVLQLGNVTDQIVFNSFSYAGYAGIQFVAENGKGPDALIVGHGIDFGTVCLDVQAAENVQMVNTQLTSFTNMSATTKSMYDVRLGPDFTGNFDLINLTMWAGPTATFDVESGTLNVYNCNFDTSAGPLISVSTKGNVNLQNVFINRNEVTVAQQNHDRISMNSVIYSNTLTDINLLTKLKNAQKRVQRWNVPGNAQFDKGAQMVFVESFDGIPTETRNGVNNVPTNAVPFTPVSQINANNNITHVVEDFEECLRMYMKGQQASVAMRNRTVELVPGQKDSLYKLEVRIKINSLHPGAGSMFTIHVASKDGYRQEMVAFTKQDGVLVNEKKIADWKTGEWYRVAVEINSKDAKKPTFRVSVYDDDYKLLGSSNAYSFYEEFSETVIGGVDLAVFSDLDATDGTSEMFVDYVFITKREASKGDVNNDGKVNTTDARLALQFAVGKVVPTADQASAADVNGNGKVDTTDARLILQYAVNKIPSL